MIHLADFSRVHLIVLLLQFLCVFSSLIQLIAIAVSEQLEFANLVFIQLRNYAIRLPRVWYILT